LTENKLELLERKQYIELIMGMIPTQYSIICGTIQELLLIPSIDILLFQKLLIVIKNKTLKYLTGKL
jgi:hypothetical protein